MKKFKIILSTTVFCAVCAAFLISAVPVSGEYRFREFNDDRRRFERYTEEAEKEVSAEEWQRILDSGREDMRASWERTADEEMRRYIREGGDDGEIRGDMEEARSEWESDFNAEEAMAKGAWFFKKEKLSSPGVNLQGLEERVKEAGSDSTIDSPEKWDAYVESTLNSVNSSWAGEFNSLIDTARLKGIFLSGKEKEGFERELAAFEKSLRDKFVLERDSVLYLARNSFIAEKFTDTDSLRRKSESESAETITEEVIQRVEGEISKEEEKILTRSFSGDGNESINFSNMGDNWQEELTKLIETGMGKWNAAREKLCNEMLNWKNSAQEAFDNIEAKWRLALETLEKAKTDWEKKLSGEIFQGLAEWQKERADLDSNIDEARRDLESYMENMNSQWGDHSQGLIDMAVNGSKVYKESLDNIKWLEGMVKQYNRQPAFTTYNETLKKVLAGDPVSADIEAIKAEMKSYGYITGNGISIKPVFLDVTYDKETGVFTEKYRLDICCSFPPCDFFPYGFEWPYKSINWDNVVTPDTPDDDRKSTYYYYLTELRRWEKIRESFSTIASDAELYMHEKDMLGDGGPGYLTNSEGGYSPNATGNAGDPYLLTGAEYELELAKRDREFWQKRLDTAKAVLEYAETAKKEGAVVTEKRKADAEVAMNEAKSAYETALKKVEDIVRDLKNKQQCEKPAGEYDPQNITAEWKTYLESIDYLTNEFSGANRALAFVEQKYEERKRTVILMENGENAEYMRKEIEEIEINLLNSDRQLFEKRTELYRTEREGEYAERSAGFAQRYEEAVKNYEDSKWRMGEFARIVSGEESDENLEKWINSLTAENTRNIIWNSNADEQASFVRTLYNDYKGADSASGDEKREKLTFYIRGIYSSLQLAERRNSEIIHILRNSSLSPDDFLRTGYSVNHALYKKYAEISVNALNIIRDAFDWSGSDENRKNYDSIVPYIRELSADSRYIYGADNSSYIAHYTALKIFENRYRGLTPETWGSSRDRLDGDILYSEKASELHDEISGKSSEELSELAAEHEANAATGYNMDSVAWLREYYLTGSGITGLEYITSVDREDEIEKIIHSQVENYIIENGRYFSREQELLKTHNYLDDVLGFIQSHVSIAAGGGEGGFSMEMLKNLSPENMSTAAGTLREYADNLERNGITIPDFIRNAAYTLAQLKIKLDTELFILSWMRGDSGMEATPEDILEKKTAEYNVSASVMNFIKSCGGLLESGTDDVSASIAILNSYEGLDESVRKFLNETDNSEIRKINSFINSLYSIRSELLVSRLAADYEKTDTSTTPDQYISVVRELSESEKASLLLQLKPVYERRLYDRVYADDEISSIDAYIASRGLSSEEEGLLRNYALIKEYNRITRGDSSAINDPLFNDYILFSGFEKTAAGIERLSSESSSDYAARCVSAYITDKGIKDQGTIGRLGTFAEKYTDKEISSLAHLPGEVKVFAASQYYYNEIYLKNRILRTGISEFLEEKFGTESIDDNFSDSVEKYVTRLNAAALYYGQDFENYIAGMSSDTRDYFLMYVYGESSAMLPGFEYGIYGRSFLVTGKGLAEQGNLGRLMDRFYNDLGTVTAAEGRIHDEAEAGVKKASALKEFTAAGGNNKGWRGSIMGMTEPGEDGKPLIIKEEISESTGWIDYSDTEGGLNNHVRYSGDITRGDVQYSLNSIVDSVNSIYSVFNSLGKVMPVEAASGWHGGIREYLSSVDSVYKTGGDYTRDESGLFSFESSIRDIAAGYESRGANFSAAANTLAGDINSREAALVGLQNVLLSKKNSFDLFGGGDRKAQLDELEKLRVEHEAAKNKTEEIRDKLSAARKAYEEINSDYVNQMSLISRNYAEYKELESVYEKAYAVWEYANTPYLREMEKNDGGITSGEVPGDENITDYTKIAVPDARENYLRIEKKFRETDSLYNKKAEAAANQETVERLKQDAEYVKLKADFKRKSETFIRISQVDEEIGEKLALYEADYNQAASLFGISKEAVKFYNDAIRNLSDDQKENLKHKRDLVLSHIAKYGVDTYMNAMALYSIHMASLWQYSSFISLNPDIKSDMELLN